MKNNKILIVGEGGQGIQVIAKIIVHAAFKSGFMATYLPNFGVEQRGGVSIAYVQISKDQISFPKFEKANIAIILSQRSILRVKEYIDDNTTIIFDNDLIPESEMSIFKNRKIAVPASYFAKEKLSPKVFNMIILGALVEDFGLIKKKDIFNVLADIFIKQYKKEPQLRHFNKRGIEMGIDILKSIKKEEKWRKEILKK